MRVFVSNGFCTKYILSDPCLLEMHSITNAAVHVDIGSEASIPSIPAHIINLAKSHCEAMDCRAGELIHITLVQLLVR